MSVEREDPRLIESSKALLKKIGRLCHDARGGLTKQVLHEIEDCIEHHRTVAKFSGVNFPKMTVLVMDRHCAVRLYRRDLSDEAIQRVMLNLVEEFPNSDAAEVARAIRRAFPHYRDPRNAFDRMVANATKSQH